MRRQVHANRRKKFSGGGSKLLTFASGTYTRASNAWYHTSASTVVQVAANTIRMESFGDRSNMVAIERSHANQIIQSEDLGNAAWVASNCTVTTNTSTDPEGGSAADTLTVTASGSASTITQTTASTNGNFSEAVYAMAGTTSQICSMTVTNGGTTVNLDFTPTASWERYRVRKTAGATPNQMILRPHAAASTGTAGDNVIMWGAYGENGTLYGSYVETVAATASTGADSLTYTSGNWDSRLATGRSEFYWSGNTDNTGMNLTGAFFSFGGANDEVHLTTTDTIEVVAGGVQMVVSGALTWSANQIMFVRLNPAAGTITVSGATTGNGTTTGTPWAWPTAVTLRVGARTAGAVELNGRISEPMTW